MSSPLFLWYHLDKLVQHCISHDRCILFLDYDGTLATIVEDPAAARMTPPMQQALTSVLEHPRYRVAIVSGRALTDLSRRLSGQGLYLAGNHGLEITGPGVHFQHPDAWRRRAELGTIVQGMAHELEAIPGAWVEDKGLTLSVHFRQVPTARVPEVKAGLLKYAHPGIEAGRLTLRTGKAVLEIRPSVEWSKGEAVSWIIEQLSQERPAASTLALYIGDDDTDEDAFHVLSCCGIGIVVGSDRNTSAARYYVTSTAEVQHLLTVLSTLSWPAP